MIRNWQIHKRSIQTLPVLILIVLGSVTQALSQQTPPASTPVTANSSQTITPAGDELGQCIQRLDKTLDALEKSENLRSDIASELVTCSSLRSKEEAYNQELLKAVALLTGAEKRNRSFFEKLQKQLEKVLAAATDPKNLITIVSLIVLTKELRK